MFNFKGNFKNNDDSSSSIPLVEVKDIFSNEDIEGIHISPNLNSKDPISVVSASDNFNFQNLVSPKDLEVVLPFPQISDSVLEEDIQDLVPPNANLFLPKISHPELEYEVQDLNRNFSENSRELLVENYNIQQNEVFDLPTSQNNFKNESEFKISNHLSTSDIFEGNNDDTQEILLETSSISRPNSELNISTMIGDDSHFQEDRPIESEKELLFEVIPVLIFCVLGSISAGYAFDNVKNNLSFIEAPGLYMMIPMLLNLKGNIETNFATRLATLANTGYLHIKSRRNAEIKAGLFLIMFQTFMIGMSSAIIVSLLVPVIALDDITPSKLSWVRQALVAILLLVGSFGAKNFWSRNMDPDFYVNPLISGTGDMVGTLLLVFVFKLSLG
ncbi:Solute carrier family 41 member 2 [Smittium mucronatum]|uniref:Solute carrier family 41 member 2 n=1 Tax=Smittium mucronatum TaxID=133383 RepID=A0A1R0H8C5_9FUNG|nr:Solute carrier family 41 member 2 [Smittium mucronatum]